MQCLGRGHDTFCGSSHSRSSSNINSRRSPETESNSGRSMAESPSRRPRAFQLIVLAKAVGPAGWLGHFEDPATEPEPKLKPKSQTKKPSQNPRRLPGVKRMRRACCLLALISHCGTFPRKMLHEINK